MVKLPPPPRVGLRKVFEAPLIGYIWLAECDKIYTYLSYIQGRRKHSVLCKSMYSEKFLKTQ